MNPIQEVSPIKLSPEKSLSETTDSRTLTEDLAHTKISDFRLSPSKDARLPITVGRSATVAGDMKVRLFYNVTVSNFDRSRHSFFL